MSVTCDDLPAFVAGELSPEDADAFRLHLADCRHCDRELLTEVQIRAILSQAEEKDPPCR